MAKNFIDAVKEMHAKLNAASTQNDSAIAQTALKVTVPFVMSFVRKNNVEFARTMRNNPSIVRSR